MSDPVHGAVLFSEYCTACHGATGVGNGRAAPALPIKPTNLQETTLTDEALKKIIRGGGKSVEKNCVMPPHLPAWYSDADLDDLVAHIRTLKKPEETDPDVNNGQ